MKKIIAILSLVGVATMAFAQGQVNFANGSTSLVSTNTVRNGVPTGPAGGPIPSFYYALFYSTTATTVATMTQLGSLGTNTVTAGRLTGGTGSANAPVLTGVGIGANVNIILAGWSANLGNNYTVAANIAANPAGFPGGYFGQSLLATMVAGGGATPIPTVMGTIAGSQIPGFLLNALDPVPEPGTMALAALGGASLLLFRRKK